VAASEVKAGGRRIPVSGQDPARRSADFRAAPARPQSLVQPARRRRCGFLPKPL